MSPQGPSRRSLLAALAAVLAGLFGLSRAAATPSAVPPSPPAPPLPPPAAEPLSPSTSGPPTWTYAYDSANRLIRCTDPARLVTTFLYDRDGNWLR